MINTNMQALLPQLANMAVCQYDNYFDSYITLTESAHYPDAIPIWLVEEAHICYLVDLRVA
jgi:hypothetical protein